MPGKDEKVLQAGAMRAAGKSVRQIAEALQVGKSTASRLLFDFDLSQNVSQGTEISGQAESGSGDGNGGSRKTAPSPGLDGSGTVPKFSGTRGFGTWDTPKVRRGGLQ